MKNYPVDQCAVNGCREKFSKGQLFCGRHWRQLPPDLRRRVSLANLEFLRGDTCESVMDTMREGRTYLNKLKSERYD